MPLTLTPSNPPSAYYPAAHCFPSCFSLFRGGAGIFRVSASWAVSSPNLVDLGPAVVSKRPGWALPVVEILPWHRREYSGSIYDNSLGVESFSYHLIVVGGGIILPRAYRRQ